jgi:hypothetical protein
VFNTFFGVSWLGLTWLYPAEVTNLRTRIQANALATLVSGMPRASLTGAHTFFR